jgi:hypothetical protein
VHVLLDQYPAKGCISSTPNWQNQTAGFIPALGRMITFNEFK